MADSRIAPYGSWKSPITSELIASGTTGLGQTAIDGEDVYWVEQRASEGGRSVIVRRAPDGRTSELTPRDFNVRTTVHEYGGGDFAVSEGVVYFSNYADQRLYRQRPGESPSPITAAMDMRYADGVVDAARNRMVCVREDHTSTWREACQRRRERRSQKWRRPRARVRQQLLLLPAASAGMEHDSRGLPGITPTCPWDGTELWMAELDAEGGLGAPVLVAGGPDESIFQPEWSPDDTLYFVSDRSGWWNLHRWCGGQVEAVLPMEAEFGVPQWGLGMSTYGFASAGRVICAYNQEGTWHVADLDTEAAHASESAHTVHGDNEIRAEGFVRPGLVRGRLAVDARVADATRARDRPDRDAAQFDATSRSSRVTSPARRPSSFPQRTD